MLRKILVILLTCSFTMAQVLSLDNPGPREPEVGPEGGPEVGPKGGPEGGLEVGPEGEPKGVSEVGPEVKPEGNPEVGPEVGPEGGPEVGPEGGPEGGLEVGSEGPAKPEVGPEVRRGKPEVGPEGPAEPKIEPEGLALPSPSPPRIYPEDVVTPNTYLSCSISKGCPTGYACRDSNGRIIYRGPFYFRRRNQQGTCGCATRPGEVCYLDKDCPHNYLCYAPWQGAYGSVPSCYSKDYVEYWKAHWRNCKPSNSNCYLLAQYM